LVSVSNAIVPTRRKSGNAASGCHASAIVEL
jgi:hypothetical protein